MDEVLTAWRRGWSPIDRRQIHEWGRQLKLEGDYARTGPFKVDRSRYLILPFTLLNTKWLRMLNILKAPQSAGSLVGDIYFHWCRRNAPGPFMWTFQSDDDAEAHYVTRVAPTIEANPTLCSPLVRQKRTLYQFPELNLHLQGANKNSLQGKTILRQINDEVWAWKDGMLAEAFARSDAKAVRYISTILNISQAGLAGDQWDLCCSRGRRHDLGVVCFKCGTLVPYQFFDRLLDKSGRPIDDPAALAGIVWDRDARRGGGWDVARAAASVRFRCRHCGHDHPFEPATLNRFADSYDYLCLDPDRPPKNTTLRWTALVNGGWDELVVEYLHALEVQAGGVSDALKTFMQKKEVVPWDDSLSEQKVALSTGEYLKGDDLSLWPNPARLPQITFLTADYQEGRGNDSEHYWVGVRCWRRGGASRLLWEGRCRTVEEIDALQVRFKVKAPCVALDGGDELLKICAIAAQRGWTVLVGDDPETFPHRAARPGARPILRPYSPRRKVDPHRGTALARRRFAYVFYWSNPSVKNITWRLRHGRGAPWELPADLSPEYRLGIDSEVKVRLVNRRDGAVSYLWKNIAPNKFNHHWDWENMQTVCALIAGLLRFEINDNTAPDPTAKPAPPPPGTAPALPADQPEQLELLAPRA
jgi:hypothetical protein